MSVLRQTQLATASRKSAYRAACGCFGGSSDGLRQGVPCLAMRERQAPTRIVPNSSVEPMHPPARFPTAALGVYGLVHRPHWPPRCPVAGPVPVFSSGSGDPLHHAESTALIRRVNHVAPIVIGTQSVSLQMVHCEKGASCPAGPRANWLDPGDVLRGNHSGGEKKRTRALPARVTTKLA